ncbi:MAG TPA: hypothetical protein VN829_05180 [Dongiaceae bacterium]|nr:hypothetical protein [Dongiaceae bacterium]
MSVYIAKIRRVGPDFLWIQRHPQGLDEFEVLEKKVCIPHAQHADQRFGVPIQTFAKGPLRIFLGRTVETLAKERLKLLRLLGHETQGSNCRAKVN